MDHTWYKCPQPCDKRHCPYCEGGLHLCTVCGGAEGSLPSECPGVLMSDEEQTDVLGRRQDFRNGAWVQLTPGVVDGKPYVCDDQGTLSMVLARTKQGLSQIQVGAQIGYHQTTISKLENRPLSQWSLQQLSDYTHALGGQVNVEIVLPPVVGETAVPALRYAVPTKIRPKVSP